jgi:uncharacterized delta-60 repeat protein
MGTAVKVSGTNFLVGGYTLANTNVFVMRFNSSGNLDTTFGNASPKDGIARVPPVSGVTVPVARTMALDSMGRILLGGSARVSSQTTFAAWRLTSAGAVDNSFSSDGFNWFNPGANVAEVYAAAVDSSNRFVMGGAFNPPGQRFLTLVRVDSNGNRDTTFNAGTPAPGWKFVDISGSTDEVVYGLAIGSSGSIAVTGQQTTDKVFLDRFTSSGSDVGLTTQDVVANKGEGGFALMIDGSGGFVVAGGILKQ